MKLGLMQEINEGIRVDNRNDPSNPEISIQGAGSHELKWVVNRVVNRLKALSQYADKASSAEEWEKVEAALDDSLTLAYVQAIVDAKKELEERQPGPKEEMRDVPHNTQGREK